ncbi:hypothetical protein H4R18_002902 [Coemansia javaensis]|uniref:Complex III subunit 9 n=1 Tax=Coemansia javaensis TaxID=2761396 RepID=A0A9W8LJE4_9FUNG|nr:hypothetical protein H4R18_002902 [Coemansia javaensis]
MVSGFVRGLSSFVYRNFFKKESTYFTTVAVTGVAFALTFNVAVDRYWDKKTAGTKWEDIKHRYVSS